jgi:broad specificity phosphatase PhoE
MGCVLDMDNMSGYSLLQDYAEFGDLLGLAKRKILENTGKILLVRHGRIVQHDGAIFLGQTDCLLSELGVEDSKIAFASLVEAADFQSENVVIISSELSRARASAEIISESILAKFKISVSVTENPFLNEVDLGRWDGRYVSDIKAEDMDLYKARGVDILGFKAHGGESFYDVRFRAMLGLYTTLKNTKKSDTIIIVCHKMIMQAILGQLQDLSDEDAMKINLGYGEVVLLNE